MPKINVVTITDWQKVPGTNAYFTSSDVCPFIKDGSLHVYNAKGTSRSWGTPKVTSDVFTLTDTVVEVDVTGWHKHTVSPVGGSYYFVFDGTAWVRRTANHKAVQAALAEVYARQALADA